ncbi:putative RNA-directed DNA polymerase from transposon BS [Stylophora pistillata]|uniref:Putative RNA-directed DNA polymerase from transposon BS n=1 Tax=Stylophora pistillata TaxID=50429 RepID=A0A2B4S755_STYPI|nr:putative RNA-directed DNA polymerase from transposon BS [Stylophora pistillata]
MFRSITTGDVQKIIMSIPSNKAPGCDKVNAKILKDSSPVIAPIITSLINDSFSLGSFPLQWKKAEIVPIIKSGDSEEPANTRPISLLPILSKVCERAAHSQLVNFLDSNNIIYQMQSGNRKFHSAETSLLYFTDELLNNMDHRKMSVIVLLDMSKAFDSIRHDLMLRKLRNVGLSEIACTWFESYLTQRQQVVKIQDTLSSPLPLTVGVPQGSILGPVLFTLYVNDLFRVPKHCKPLGYVDDTKIFLGFPSNKLQDVISAVNEDLEEILSWCCRNSLLINPDKTKLLYVGVPQLMRTLPATLPSATILGTEIKPVTVVKDLGVHIDCHLNFNEHITKTVSDCQDDKMDRSDFGGGRPPSARGYRPPSGKGMRPGSGARGRMPPSWLGVGDVNFPRTRLLCGGCPPLDGMGGVGPEKPLWGAVMCISAEPLGNTNQLDHLVSEHRFLFENSYEDLQGLEAHITIKEGAEPVFFKPRKVPYVFKDAVESELDKLEKNGVIKKVERSEWASPIVVVPKADKSVRIRGDYKVTINQLVEDEPYPLPTTQDLYTSLSGSKVFSKLDLSHAYAQLSVDKESQEYLTNRYP